MFPGAMEQLLKEPAVENLQVLVMTYMCKGSCILCCQIISSFHHKALLQCVCTSLRDPSWSETDRSEHYRTIKILLEELKATLRFIHSCLAEETVFKVAA